MFTKIHWIFEIKLRNLNFYRYLKIYSVEKNYKVLMQFYLKK